MKRPEISIPALFAVCAGVCLFATAFPARAGAAADDRPHHVIDGAGRVQLVVGNPNACAPFVAEAVWGRAPTAAPIGYRCFPEVRGFRN